MNKKALNLWIFTIGVVMLLLRPYIVYQLTQSADNPYKAYSLLQRLVKKKDEHRELSETGVTETRRFNFVFRPPIIIIKAFFGNAGILSIIASFLVGRHPGSFFDILPQNHRYRSLSCFLI